MKFRKKPVEVDAWGIRWLIGRAALGVAAVPHHVRGGIDNGTLRFAPEGLYIKTLEGGMFGRPEDVLIMGVQGEFYPCKSDIFAKTYERVRDETSR